MLCEIQLPYVSNGDLQLSPQLNLLRRPGLAGLDQRNTQINKGILELLNMTFLDDLYKLDGLESCYDGSCGC